VVVVAEVIPASPQAVLVAMEEADLAGASMVLLIPAAAAAAVVVVIRHHMVLPKEPAGLEDQE
jgi:hypothetical protein